MRASARLAPQGGAPGARRPGRAHSEEHGLRAAWAEPSGRAARDAWAEPPGRPVPAAFGACAEGRRRGGAPVQRSRSAASLAGRAGARAWGSPTASAARRIVSWAWGAGVRGDAAEAPGSPFGKRPSAGPRGSSRASAAPPGCADAHGALASPSHASLFDPGKCFADEAEAAVARGCGAAHGHVSVVGTLDVEEEEWLRYGASLELFEVPTHASLLPLLGRVLASVPVPAPWLLCRGSRGELFFANETTSTSTYAHPFHGSLLKLARVLPVLLRMPSGPRRSLIRGLLQAWDSEAKHDYSLWRTARSDSGQDYYYHSETLATMWEDPKEAILLSLDLKCKAVCLLDGDAYCTQLLADPHDDVRSSAVQALRSMTEPLSEAAAELLSDDCGWIRAAAADALADTGDASKSPGSTTTSWFSATSRLTVQSAP